MSIDSKVTRRSDRVGYSQVFAPTEDNEWEAVDYADPSYSELIKCLKERDNEYVEARQWLDQFYPCTANAISTNRRVLLLVGTESYPEEVWSCRKNHYRTICYLEWKRPEEPDET